LLDKLKLHPSIDLQAVVVFRESDKQQIQKPFSALLSAGQWLLHKKIDKSRFSQNPWEPQSLPDDIALLEQEDAIHALHQCRVVLNLCNEELPLTLISNPTTCIWSAQLNNLDARIEQTLLDQDPLSWVYLWTQTVSNASVLNPATLIAAHALPRQSYSLTDLRKAAYFCLPSLITSRLNWVAQQSNLISLELDNPAITCNPISEERAQSNQRAESLINSNATPIAGSDTDYLIRAIKLFYRQTLQRISDRIWIEQWQLAVFNHDQQSSGFISDIAATRLEDYRAIASPRNLLRADPHVLEHSGQVHMLFEEMPTTGSKAHISSAKLDKAGATSEFKVVLKEEQHLSYPFLFSHEGIVYMIPETASRKTVSLYQAQDFPERWVRVCDLLSDINAADTTVLYHENRWWLFTNSQTHPVVHERDELLLYYADDIAGPWQAHPLNPVITGVDRSRMAGPILLENGVLHRPSQYGAVRYGHGINLNRIDQLNPTHYQETPIARILPEPGSRWKGCHSITRVQGLTILDRVCRQRR